MVVWVTANASTMGVAQRKMRVALQNLQIAVTRIRIGWALGPVDKYASQWFMQGIPDIAWLPLNGRKRDLRE